MRLTLRMPTGWLEQERQRLQQVAEAHARQVRPLLDAAARLQANAETVAEHVRRAAGET